MATPEERFEQELAKAMQRVNAPRSLEVNLLHIAEAEQVRNSRQSLRLFNFPKPRAWAGLAAAAAIVVGCVTAEGVHLHREKERAVANQQFAEATAITNRTLERTREKLERAGINLED